MIAAESEHQSERSGDRLTEISPAGSSDKPAWDQFVLSNPQSTFFHRFGWGEVVQNVYGHRAIYLKAECETAGIVGILPLILVKSPIFGASLISTAFTVGGGVLAEDEIVHAALLEKACEIAAENNVQYVELRGGGLVKGWHAKAETYVGFSKALPVDEDKNLKEIPRKKRADVRKGIKAAENEELKFIVEKNIEEFYRLYAESVRNLGTPVPPKKLFDELFRQFPGEAEVSFVRSKGEAVTALLSFYHHQTVLPYYAGSTPMARRVHAYDYMYWRQMRQAVQRGCAEFDFGRSKIGTGAYAYKTHWGFVPESLTYQYYLVKTKSVPDVNPNNPKFKLITKAWQKLPLPLANMLGPVLARNLA